MIKRTLGLRCRSALTVIGATCLSLWVAGAAAYADTIGGHSGHGWPNSDAACFEGSHSRMFNKCPDPKRLVIPLHVRSFKDTTITVLAFGGDTFFGTACQAIRHDGRADGTNSVVLQPATPVSTPFGSRTAILLALGKVNVPKGATLFVECVVGPRGFVQSVEWTQ